MSFLKNRSTTLLFNEVKTEEFSVRSKASQDSSLSSILFLLYNVKLMKLCSISSQKVHKISFVNNLNMLIYSLTTEANCATLSRVHKQCLRWAEIHEIIFASHKYELIHISIKIKRHNLAVSINLKDVMQRSEKSVQVLRVWLNSKLRWTSHVKVIDKREAKSWSCFKQINMFTWGADFLRAQLLYNSSVKLTLIYRAEVWREERKNITVKKVKLAQNKCLRTVNEAFKATSIRELKAEVYILLIDLMMKEQRAVHMQQMF